MTGKTVSRQAVRERASALSAGARPKTVDALNDEVADRNVEALDDMARQMRQPAREAVREEPLPPGAVRGRNGEVLTRKRSNTVNIFEVPADLKDPDWSYEWKVETVLNQPDQPRQMQYLENGWRPVMNTGRWTGIFMPETVNGVAYTGPIRRDGQVLMERPIELTRQAEADERRAAAAQMRNTRESLRLAMPSGFSQEHAGVAPKLNQSWERGPAPDKRALVSD